MLMKLRLLLLAALFAGATDALAMPTDAELQAAEPQVYGLLGNDQRNVGAQARTRLNVAEAAARLCDQTDSEAARLLLLKGAFVLCVRDGALDRAVEILDRIRREISDVPPRCLARLITASLREAPPATESALYRQLGERRLYDIYGVDGRLDADGFPFPDGLAHRWSFTTDGRDSVGGVNALLCGGTAITNGQCFTKAGYVCLNNAARDLRGDFTIEVWYTELEYAYGCRVFCLRGYKNDRHVLAWITGPQGRIYYSHPYGTSSYRNLSGFETGRPTYVAVTASQSGEGMLVTAYKYDRESDRMENFATTVFPKDSRGFDIRKLFLGRRAYDDKSGKYHHSTSAFDECRVWTRCLTPEEIRRSARSGPDSLPGIQR